MNFMKKNILLLMSMFAMLVLNTSCNKWTEVEAENIDKHLAGADSTLAESHRKYLENLRAYKESDHQVTFGWYGGWSANGPKARYLYHLPDSTDFVSIWGGWSNLTKEQQEDLHKSQKEKGLKALTCVLMFQIGDAITPSKPEADKDLTWNQWQHKFWGWVDGDTTAINKAIMKYANALCDTIDKYGYNGFDLDAEPSYPQPFETNYEMWGGRGSNDTRRMELFIKTMAKRIGPKAETAEGRKKLLVVDGEPDWFPAYMGEYFNYFILQAYSCRSYTDLENRYERLCRKFVPTMSRKEVAKKLIVTETFEQYAATGGVTFTTRDGRTLPSYLGMADWNPKDGVKGGIGSYHMEMDYAQTPVYKYLREGIQIMNPAAK